MHRKKLKHPDSENTDKQEEVALAVVKSFREKYKIDQNINLLNYKAYVIGNDPTIDVSQYAATAAKGSIALVATSGMRAVQLACQLATKLDKHLIPKIFIVDNSDQVHKLWKNFKKFFSSCKEQKSFEKNIHFFLKTNKELYNDLEKYSFLEDYSEDNDNVKYPSQNIPKFFKDLFTDFGFNYVRSIIFNAICIKQSWTDTNVFKKINIILDFFKIKQVYVYVSNIAFCIDEMQSEKLDAFLNHIASMHPTLSIHTNYCHEHHKPDKVFLCEDSHPEQVKNKLFTFFRIHCDGDKGVKAMLGSPKVTLA